MHHNDRDDGQDEKPRKCSVLSSEFEYGVKAFGYPGLWIGLSWLKSALTPREGQTQDPLTYNPETHNPKPNDKPWGRDFRFGGFKSPHERASFLIL